MENILQPFFILILSFLFIVLMKVFYLNPRLKKRFNLPPGPITFPVVGSVHCLLSSYNRKPMQQALRELAYKYGPLMSLKLGEIDFVIATSSEAALEINKTNDINFASRPKMFASKYLSYGGRDIIFAPYGEYWRQLRKIAVIELLSIKRVSTFESIREREIMSLMKYIMSMNGVAPVNLTKLLLSLMNDITATAAFGNKCSRQKEYLATMEEMRKFSSVFNVVDLFPSSKLLRWITGAETIIEKLHHTVDEVLDGIVQERKKCRKAAKNDRKTGELVEEEEEENLLDVLLRLQESEEFALSNDQVKAIIWDIIQGGTRTSASAMAWAMSELMQNPRTMKKAQAEVRGLLAGKPKLTEEDIHKLQYLKLVIKETLRLHPSAPLLVPRLCSESCTVLGYKLPSNSRVLINAWAIARNPKYWDKPEEFLPERFENSSIHFSGTNFEFLPFGAGRRICPGVLFANAAMEATLARLICYFDWELPNGALPHELDMSESLAPGGGRKLDLVLCAKPIYPFT